MENEEIMMNEETSTEELVPVEDNAIDDTALTVEEESSEGGSAAGAVALVGMGLMAVVGTSRPMLHPQWRKESIPSRQNSAKTKSSSARPRKLPKMKRRTP